jgi:hypothetical protein
MLQMLTWFKIRGHIADRPIGPGSDAVIPIRLKRCKLREAQGNPKRVFLLGFVETLVKFRTASPGSKIAP